MTTNSIHDAFINALFADAAYVNLLDDNHQLVTADIILNRLGERLTPALAQYFVDHFEVVTQVDTDDATGSGFDATVFRSKDTQQVYVSMRGTETGVGGADLFADVELTNPLIGLALNQVGIWSTGGCELLRQRTNRLHK